MKKITILLFGLSLLIMTSCSTQQRFVSQNCDCNTTNFDLRWNTNPFWWNGSPFWGWNTSPFWWNNDPFWGWNRWNYSPFRYRPIVYVNPRIIQPSPQPTRYERRSSIVANPNRSEQNQQSVRQRRSQTNYVDDIYYRPSQSSRVRTNTSTRVQTPSRTQQRVIIPNTSKSSRVQLPTRTQQRVSTPTRTQSSRVQLPTRTQQKVVIPKTSQTTRSRVRSKGN